MSRCFPYPPPGYVKIGIRDQPQTESIKLKKEEEKARKDKKEEEKARKDRKEEEKARKDRKEEEKARKDRKEEEKARKDRKKEKKREKKEKERAKEGKEVESKKHSHKKRHRDEKSKDSKGDDPQKRRKTELENSDKSTLTEEHEPAAGSQNSSDSTLNSNKRLKESSPPDSCLNSGITVRIAPTSRQKDSKVQPIKEQPPSGLERQKDSKVQPIKEQPPSGLERINVVFDQQMDEAAPRPGKEPGDDPCSSSQTPRITLKLRKESPFQTSCASERSAGKTEETSTLKLSCASERSAGKAGETSTQKLPCASERSAGKAEGTSTQKLSCASERSAGKAEGTSTPKLCSICPPTLALQFKSLVEDWIQPPTESVGFEDQEWLSQTKRNPQPVVKRTELGITGSSRETSDHWPPRACHLPEVDIYALPFTIPF